MSIATPAEPTSAAEKPMRPAFSLTLLLGALTAVTALAIDMSLPALPQLQATFGGEVERVQLTLSLFLLGFGAGQFVCGPLSDHYGRRPLILAGLLVYAAAGFAASFATSLTMLIAFRLLQGIGASVGPILSRAIVRDLFSHRDASAVLSHITQVMVIAPMVAPTLGGVLLRWFGWPSIFLALGGIGLALAAITWLTLPETIHRKAGHARIGQALASYGAVLSHVPTLRYVLAICFTAAGMFAYVSGSPYVLMEVYGVPREHFGYYFAVPALALLAGAAANRGLVQRLDTGVLLRRGINTMVAAAVLMLALNFWHVGGAAAVIVPMMVYMFGMALAMPNATTAALSRHGAIAGAASSLIGAIQTLFSALSAYLVGAFYNQTSWSLVGVMVASALLTASVCRCEPKLSKKVLNPGVPPPM